MVKNILSESFLEGGVNLVHFSFIIMRGKNGRYDHLNFPCEKIGVERKLLIDHNHVSQIRIETKTPCLIVLSLQQVTP